MLGAAWAWVKATGFGQWLTGTPVWSWLTTEVAAGAPWYSIPGALQWLAGVAAVEVGAVAFGAAVLVAAAVAVGVVAYTAMPDKPIVPTDKGSPEARGAAGTITPKKPLVPGGGETFEAYNIYVLALSGGSIWIGQESQLGKMHPCNFSGGGDNCTDPVEVMHKDAGKDGKGWSTAEEAHAAWCTLLKQSTTYHVEVADDSKAKVYGGAYWIGTVDACPA